MSNAAVMTASWAKRGRRNAITSLSPSPMMPGSSIPSQGANDPIGVKVEIFVNNGWEDITSFVMYRNGTGRVSISRGKPNESGPVQPQTCSLELSNRDDRFSPRNPAGPYYGSIGRNTPLRVSRTWNGVRWYRFYGEVPTWPVSGDISGNDVSIQVQATGILRRINQGTPPVDSAMRRNIVNPMRIFESAVFDYWPLEDPSGATQFASALSGGIAAVISNQGIVAASSSGWLASNPLPVFNLGSLDVQCSSYKSTGVVQARFNLILPSAGVTGTSTPIILRTSGTVSKVVLLVGTSAPNFDLGFYDQSGTLFSTIPNFSVGVVNGNNTSMTLQLTQVGADINWLVTGTNVATFTYANGNVVNTTFGTVTGHNFGRVTSVQIGGAFGGSGGMGASSIGHVALANTANAFTNTGLAMFAANGEPVFSPDAAALNDSFGGIGRFVRLCNEMSISGSEVYGSTFSGDSTTMGSQLPSTYVSLIQQCADTDLSLIYEPRDQVGVALRSRLSLYNQPPKLTMDYAQHQLSGQAVPLDDDTYTRNDVTATRIGGSSATAQLTDTSYSLNLNTPPLGVGDYSTNPQISVGFDTELNDQAGWRLHMGTDDEPRYPKVSVNLNHPAFRSGNDLTNAVLGIDIGDRIVIANPPPWLPPDYPSVIVQGYQESLGEWEHDIVFNTSPETPYHIAVLDDRMLSRADTDGSVLTNGISTNLATNPGFSAPTGAAGVLAGSMSGWAAKNGSLTSVGGDSGAALPSGAMVPWGCLLTPNGVGQSLVWQGDSAVTASRFTAVGGNTYYASAIVYSPGGYGQVQLGIDWWDSTGAFISTLSSVGSVNASVLTTLSMNGTAPPNAATGSVNVGENSIGGTPPSSSNMLYVIMPMVWTGTFNVSTSNPSSPLWTTSYFPFAPQLNDFPLDVNVGGERITVQQITGSSSPQTFTVVRGVNGVVKPQAAGTDVRLWQPMILSL